MTTLLQIDASMFGEKGKSRTLTDDFVTKWRENTRNATVVRRDLAATEIPHLTADAFSAGLTPEEERTTDQANLAALGDQLITELFAADVIVIGVPVYNFLIPSQLKAWFDHVARARTTFRYSEDGPVGLLGGRKVHVFIASGGQYKDTDLDFPARYIRHMLGFLGLDDVTITYAEGLAMGDEAAEASLAGARQEIESLVA